MNTTSQKAIISWDHIFFARFLHVFYWLLIPSIVIFFLGILLFFFFNEDKKYINSFKDTFWTYYRERIHLLLTKILICLIIINTLVLFVHIFDILILKSIKYSDLFKINNSQGEKGEYSYLKITISGYLLYVLSLFLYLEYQKKFIYDSSFKKTLFCKIKEKLKYFFIIWKIKTI